MTAVALYLHVPFCAHKCPYCDFNAYSGLGRMIAPFVDALCREVGAWSGLLRGCTVPSISLGGGTPSLLSGEQLRRVLDTCRERLEVEPGAEVSLEANPGTLSVPKLTEYRAAGVNRLSLGAQSFAPHELRWLGRDHSPEATRTAVRLARAAGFDNLNLDLIFGLPGGSLPGWQESLGEAVSLEPEHLSLYALTVEEGTPLARSVASGRRPQPDPDLAADCFLAAEAVLWRAGFEHYEISNWAKPGHRSRHNTTYWLNQPYIGLGPGAHSYFGDLRWSNARPPGEYLRRVTRLGASRRHGSPRPQPLPVRIRRASPVADMEQVDASTDLFDTLTQGLRLVREGIDLAAVSLRHGASRVAALRPVFESLQRDGLLEHRGSRLRLTRRGRLLANEAFVRLLEALRQTQDHGVPCGAGAGRSGAVGASSRPGAPTVSAP